MNKTWNRGTKLWLDENFNTLEFQCKCGKCVGQTVDEKLVTILQTIRYHFGKPVILNSGYRCSKHNTAVSGAKNSQHLYGKAADIRISGISPIGIAQYAEKIEVPKGIILYPSFVHIDTRDTKFFSKDSGATGCNTFGGYIWQ